MRSHLQASPTRYIHHCKVPPPHHLQGGRPTPKSSPTYHLRGKHRGPDGYTPLPPTSPRRGEEDEEEDEGEETSNEEQHPEAEVVQEHEDTVPVCNSPPPEDPPDEPPNSPGDTDSDSPSTPSGRVDLLDIIDGIHPVCDIGAALKILARMEDNIQEELDNLVDRLHRTMVAAGPQEERVMRRRGASGPSRSERTRRSVARYARTQELWKRNPSRLADLVLNNQLEGLAREKEKPTPPPEATIAFYHSLWETASGAVPDLEESTPERPDTEIRPITAGEVIARVRRLKPWGAPGIDGVKKNSIFSTAMHIQRWKNE